MRRFILTVFLGLVLAPASTRAQTNTAVVFGSVTDAQKGVLPGVTVTARNVDTGTETVEATDERGRFRLGGLRPGAYEIRADIQGFSSQVKKGIQLFLGQEATIDFELTVAGVVETLTVTASTPLVEVTKSEVSNVVDRRQIDALPLADRNFANLTRLTPGVVGADLIGGQQSTTSNAEQRQPLG
jgi:hypothetical protein